MGRNEFRSAGDAHREIGIAAVRDVGRVGRL